MTYYTKGTPATRLTLARAENIAAELTTIVAAFDKVPPQLELEQDRAAYALDTGAVNAYAVALPHTLAAYTAGLGIRVKIVNANTGASTINVDSLGVKTITRLDGTGLSAGDLPAGAVVELYYDGANFQLSGNPTVAPLNLGSNNVTATGSPTARSLATRAADVYNVLDHGLKGDGSTSDTAAFDTLIALIVAKAVPAIVWFPTPSVSYKFNTPVASIDASYITLLVGNAIMDFTACVATPVLPMKGTNAAINQLAVNGIWGGIWLGPGEDGGINLSDFDGTSPGVNRISLNNMFIQGFEDVWTLGDNAFLITWNNINQRACTRGIVHPSSTNAGERMVLNDYQFGRGDRALDIANSGDYIYNLCGFDNISVILAAGGRHTFNDPHVEELSSKPWVYPPFHLSAGTGTIITINGGQATSSATSVVKHLWQNDVAPGNSSSIFVNGMRRINLGLTSPHLAGGQGDIYIVGAKANNELVNKQIPGPICNRMANGSFAGGTLDDPIYPDSAANGVTLTVETASVRQMSFNANTDVDLTTDKITVTGHGYWTGKPLVYANGGGTSLGGLVTATEYFAIFDTVDRIQLATTAANAYTGTAIDLTTKPASETHTLDSGTNGLLLDVTGANANVFIIKPITPGIQIGQCSFWYEQTAAGSGAAWRARYVRGRVNDAGEFVIGNQSANLNSSTTLTDTSWTFKGMDKIIQAPNWAEYFALIFAIGALNPDNLRVTDIIIN